MGTAAGAPLVAAAPMAALIGIVPQAQPPPPPQQGGGGNTGGPAPGGTDYSSIEAALQRLGHTMYNPATIDAKLRVQSTVIPGDSTSRAGFCNFVANIQQLRLYLAMLGGQLHVMMIHTPGVYYSIKLLTSAYQGKMMAFIGDCRVTKEPTPVCLPTTKAWKWHTGNAIADFTKAEAHYSVEVNKGTLWTWGGTDGLPSAMTRPNLLAIRNAFGDLLRTPGLAITPHDVLTIVEEFIQNSGHPPGQQWECVQRWCLVACQTGNNGKSKVFLDTIPVTIDDDKFDR